MNRPVSMRAATIGSIASCLALSACMLGPDYQGPPGVADASISRATFLRADGASVDPGPPPERWWEAMSDPVLVRIVDDAFAASPTLKQVIAQVRSARAQILVDEGNLLPKGGTNTSYSRLRIPTENLLRNVPIAAGSTLDIPGTLKSNSYAGGLDALWEFDLFGGVRRSVESASANAESIEASFHDAQVTLASNVVDAYAKLREAQNRVAVAMTTAALDARALEVMRRRRERGTATEIEVQQMETQGAQDRAQLPALRFTVDEQLDQIAILCGREPGAYDAILDVPAGAAVAQPLPPARTPVGTPADWLRNRPDIRQAERTIAARNATIGQYVADYFPKVSVIGIVERMGQAPGDLFRGQALTVLSPSMSWSFFTIPQTRGRVKAAEAERDAALASYEKTVLAALQDANDSVSRFGHSQQTAVDRNLAVVADERAAALTRQRYERGTATVGDTLTADRTLARDADESVQARSNLMQAWVSLQKSLGLGWGALPPTSAIGHDD